MTHFFTDLTSCCDVFPLVYCGQSLGYDCISSWALPSSLDVRCIRVGRKYGLDERNELGIDVREKFVV